LRELFCELSYKSVSKLLTGKQDYGYAYA